MSPSRPSSVRIAHLLALAACAATLAACGSSSPTSASGERASERSNEVKLADYARCLREHGIDAKASTGGEGPGVGVQINGIAKGGGQAAMEAAQSACKKYQPAPRKAVKLSPQQKVEQEEGVRKFAACMRSRGVDVHASATEGNVQIQVHAAPGSGGPNPQSPTFQKAQEACGKYMRGPNGGKFKAPSGPPGNSQEGSSGASLSIGG